MKRIKLSNPDRADSPATFAILIGPLRFFGLKSPVINLPFFVTFYGLEYDFITVNTNGWIAFGSSEMKSFRNTPIPGPGGPSPMLSVFWDDLTTGNVYYDYNEELNSFIIQWSDMHTYEYESPVSFQAIIFGNNGPSESGDNDIIIQYLEFNNTSSGYYPSSYSYPTHGGHATIGVENESANIGLQYTYNNEYPMEAAELNDRSAIHITTRPSLNIIQADQRSGLPGMVVHFSINENYSF